MYANFNVNMPNPIIGIESETNGNQRQNINFKFWAGFGALV